MKKLVAVVLSLTLLLGLFGCGGSNKTNDDALNKTVEVPGGTLSFKVNDEWKSTEDDDLGLDTLENDLGIAMFEDGALGFAPLAETDDLIIACFHTSLSGFGVTGDMLTPEVFDAMLEGMSSSALSEYKIEELTLDESFSEYYYFAFSAELESEYSGSYHSYQIFLLDQSGISSISITVSADVFDQWENTVEEVIASVKPLANAQTKAQIAELSRGANG